MNGNTDGKIAFNIRPVSKSSELNDSVLHCWAKAHLMVLSNATGLNSWQLICPVNWILVQREQVLLTAISLGSSLGYLAYLHSLAIQESAIIPHVKLGMAIISIT